VELAGDLHESRLSKLVIRSFSDAGIVCKGAQGLSFGTNQLLLEEISFEPSTATSVGIRLVAGAENSVESIVVKGCRFLGPMAVGIDFQDQSPYGIDVLESIFNKTTDGIRFSNQPLLRSIHIVNNSFRQTRNGIRFDKIPKDQSIDLSFRRNLFVGTEHGECVVQRSYDEGKFRPMLTTTRPAVQNNMSDRAKPTPPYDDEVALFFEDGGLQGEPGFALASVDPKSPKFMAPTENIRQKKVDGAQPPDRDWVGAVGP
jgi:hypothetical protein